MHPLTPALTVETQDRRVMERRSLLNKWTGLAGLERPAGVAHFISIVRLVRSIF